MPPMKEIWQPLPKIPYRIGREARSPEEPHAGRIYTNYFRHVAGVPSNTILPHSTGEPDHRSQAFTYRLTGKDYGRPDHPFRIQEPPQGMTPVCIVGIETQSPSSPIASLICLASVGVEISRVMEPGGSWLIGRNARNWSPSSANMIWGGFTTSKPKVSRHRLDYPTMSLPIITTFPTDFTHVKVDASRAMKPSTRVIFTRICAAMVSGAHKRKFSSHWSIRHRCPQRSRPNTFAGAPER